MSISKKILWDKAKDKDKVKASIGIVCSNFGEKFKSRFKTAKKTFVRKFSFEVALLRISLLFWLSNSYFFQKNEFHGIR